MGSELETTFVAHTCHHHHHHPTIDHFLQTLNNWLVKPLPKGSALTAIFDSCTSGTLLGNVPSMHTRCPLSLTPGKTLTITSAITSIGRGSTREDVKAIPFETALVGCHPTCIIARRLTPSFS